MSRPLLEVRDLHVRFRHKKQELHAVRGVSFSLFSSEIVGVVGESGSGKSALAKAILQLLSPLESSLSGSIYYQEQDLCLLKEKQMQKIRGSHLSMIFQDSMTSLNPTMTIGAQITEMILHHKPLHKKQAYAEAVYLLKQVGLSDPERRANEYPHTLSGGMRQRAAIAIAIAANPKILIADEPTTALDVTVQAEIVHLLKTIQRENKTTILFITHDLSVVASLCDRVLVMCAGQIVESAPVDTLFENPSHLYTKSLLQSLFSSDLPSNTSPIPVGWLYHE